MTRIGRDSITLTDIPVSGTDMPMVYGNGSYGVSYAEVAARFPGKPIAWYDVLGTRPDLDMLDVENGDATPAMAPPWVKLHNALKSSHYPGIVYVNRSNITAVFNEMNAAGLHVGHDFHLGISTLDGTKTVGDMTGVTFVQDKGAALTGGHWDEAIIYDDSFKMAKPPPPPPPPPKTFVLPAGKFTLHLAQPVTFTEG